MDVLFHDVKLNYYVPIISQQGEVAGKLQVYISVVLPVTCYQYAPFVLPRSN